MTFRRLGQAMRSVVAVFDLRDMHFYGGLAVAMIGGWRLSPAWTLITAGITLALVGLWQGGKR